MIIMYCIAAQSPRATGPLRDHGSERRDEGLHPGAEELPQPHKRPVLEDNGRAKNGEKKDRRVMGGFIDRGGG